MRKDDSVERIVIFTFHVVFPKRKDSIKSGSCKPEASIYSVLPLFSLTNLLLRDVSERQ